MPMKIIALDLTTGKAIYEKKDPQIASIELEELKNRCIATFVGHGASDEQINNIMKQCLVWGKRADGGLEEVYRHFIDGGHRPRHEWLKSAPARRYDEAAKIYGWEEKTSCFSGYD